VVLRGPLLDEDSRPATDPDAIDPIVAALGPDRPTRSERERQASAAAARQTAQETAQETVPETPQAAAAEPDNTGPSDTTDRD
jgi:hypothetical protein